MSRITAAGVAAASGAGAFLAYGMARTMEETVGFTWRGTGYGVFVCLWFAIPALGVLLLAARLVSRGRRPLPAAATAAFVIGLAAGCVVSEISILLDESAFAAEVARDPARTHDRARAWPNGNAGLVYLPGEGTHATD